MKQKTYLRRLLADRQTAHLAHLSQSGNHLTSLVNRLYPYPNRAGNRLSGAP